MGASEVRGTEDQNYAPEPPGPFVTAPKKLTSAARAGACASVCVRVFAWTKERTTLTKLTGNTCTAYTA